MASTLGSGASTTFTITFTPAATGARSAALHIATTGAGANPLDVTLAGTGLDTLPPTPLETWKLSHLGNANAPDLDDPDLDGFTNLVEYALLLPPVSPGGNPLISSRFTYPDGNRLRIFVPRDPSHNDITIFVEASEATAGPWEALATSTLGAAFTGPGYVGGDSPSPDLKSVEVRDTVNSGGRDAALHARAGEPLTCHIGIFCDGKGGRRRCDCSHRSEA